MIVVEQDPFGSVKLDLDFCLEGSGGGQTQGPSIIVVHRPVYHRGPGHCHLCKLLYSSFVLQVPTDPEPP